MKRFLSLLVLAPLAFAAHAIVNVNTAQQSELERTRGLDKAKAKALIEHRSQHGPFDSLDDLRKVPGFTPEVVARAGPEIAFTGDPHVPSKVSASKSKDAKDRRK
jgi:competence protein ComEA